MTAAAPGLEAATNRRAFPSVLDAGERAAGARAPRRRDVPICCLAAWERCQHRNRWGRLSPRKSRIYPISLEITVGPVTALVSVSRIDILRQTAYPE